MKNLVTLIGRILLSSMFIMSVINNLTGGFKGSVAYVKSINFPLPEVSVIGGMIIKSLGAYSLITGHLSQYILPLLIGFVILVTILFNNPLKKPDKLWKFMSLLGVIGGLLIVYQIDTNNL